MTDPNTHHHVRPFPPPEDDRPEEGKNSLVLGLIQIGLIVGVIVAALAVNMILSRNAGGPGRFAQGASDMAVEVVRPRAVQAPILVQETGTVQVRAYVNLSPQVGGRVREISPNLAAGGSFAAGETLFRIDPSDYRFAYEQARSNVETAQSALELEQAEAETARREWELVNPGEDIPALVARTPQIRQARAALASAESVLEAARTDLQRVDYSLPFEGRVVATSVAEGQTLAANQSYGQVYRLSALEVAVPVSAETLALLEPAAGRAATVRTGAAGQAFAGQVVRQEAELDAQTRFATLIVGFETAPPLLPGAFVDVTIDGGMAEDVMILPAASVGNGGRVWVVDGGVLALRDPAIVSQDDEEVMVRAFDTAEGVVVTPLASPAEDFPVTIVGERQ